MTAVDDPSGLTLAQAAHDAGAVTPTEPQPIYDVTIACTVTGSRGDAEYVGAVIEQHALRLSAVRGSALTVVERA